MRLSSGLILASVATSATWAAPSTNEQWPMFDAAAANAPAFSLASTPAVPLFGWLSSYVSKLVPDSVSTAVSNKKAAHSLDWQSWLHGDTQYASLDKPDYSDSTIWEVIQENEYLTDLKRVLKYSGPGAKELLDDKSKKLTFLIPVNWHRHRDGKKDLASFAENDVLSQGSTSMAQWNAIEHQINALENEKPGTFKDDKDKERKRKILAKLIDATLKYHVIKSEEPLRAWDVIQNSTVASGLNIGNGRAKEILGNLLFGEQFRLRVGKSLLPKPSAYFNFYSRLVYPDVNIGGSLVHAVSFPLLIPPSALQTLFFSSPDLAGTTTALQKVHVDGYLRYPINRTAIHEHNDYMPYGFARSSLDIAEHPQHMFAGEDVDQVSSIKKEEPHHHYHHHAKGQAGLTVFAPGNIAWYRLPPPLRLFLLSPFGSRILGLVLALHSLPKTIFYADFVVSKFGNKDQIVNEQHETISALNLMASNEWLWGPTSPEPAVAMGEVDVTRYTFKTACPKLHFNRADESGYSVMESSRYEFETVDVAVYRYKVFPGGKGPLQTRVSVQGVPVLFQDIAAGNGALHVIERFIMPKNHTSKDADLWIHAAGQAEKYGFGSIDVKTELF